MFIIWASNTDLLRSRSNGPYLSKDRFSNWLYALNYISYPNLLFTIYNFLLFFFFLFFLAKQLLIVVASLEKREQTSKRKKFRSKNKEADVQWAGNSFDSSETTRQLSNDFITYLAGVIDGDENFYIRKNNDKFGLKSIRVKLHVRDIKILIFIPNNLHKAIIKTYKNNPYALWVVSTLLFFFTFF